MEPKIGKPVVKEHIDVIDLEWTAPLPLPPQGDGTMKSKEEAKTPSERFHERMDRIRDADFAELDDQLDDPNYRPEPVAWRENGPDPFGVGWTWLKPKGEPPNAEE
jgi:hypothetical protein